MRFSPSSFPSNSLYVFIYLLIHLSINLLINLLIHPRPPISISIHSSSTNAGGGGLHCIVLGVVKQVDNLRSAVAKNALLTLGDMFQGLGKAMDVEVSLALTCVLKVSYRWCYYCYYCCCDCCRECIKLH